MKEGGVALMHVFLFECIVNLFFQKRLMDVYEIWERRSTHGPAPVFRLYGKLCSGVDPGRDKNWLMRVPFPKDFFLKLEG